MGATPSRGGRPAGDDLGIPETRAGLDAQLILDAAGRSTRLWPDGEG